MSDTTYLVLKTLSAIINLLAIVYLLIGCPIAAVIFFCCGEPCTGSVLLTATLIGYFIAFMTWYERKHRIKESVSE